MLQFHFKNAVSVCDQARKSTRRSVGGAFCVVVHDSNARFAASKKVTQSAWRVAIDRYAAPNLVSKSDVC